MDKRKGLITRFGEMIDQYHDERRAVAQESTTTEHLSWLHWIRQQMMPNIGTLLMVVVLLLTVPSLAAPLMSPSATSTSTISFQGRLADSDGNPLTGFHTMEFRIYDVPTGGVPLWEEFWTGANSVSVSDGLFNVMLGSINNTLAESIVGHDELYLGITVDTDSEMEPRVQLGSVPFSMQAMTVVDRSITTNKIADGAVTSAKLNIDDGLEINGTAVFSGPVDLQTWEQVTVEGDAGTFTATCPPGKTIVFGWTLHLTDDGHHSRNWGACPTGATSCSINSPDTPGDDETRIWIVCQ